MQQNQLAQAKLLAVLVLVPLLVACLKLCCLQRCFCCCGLVFSGAALVMFLGVGDAGGCEETDSQPSGKQTRQKNCTW